MQEAWKCSVGPRTEVRPSKVRGQRGCSRSRVYRHLGIGVIHSVPLWTSNVPSPPWGAYLAVLGELPHCHSGCYVGCQLSSFALFSSSPHFWVPVFPRHLWMTVSYWADMTPLPSGKPSSSTSELHHLWSVVGSGLQYLMSTGLMPHLESGVWLITTVCNECLDGENATYLSSVRHPSAPV